MILARMGGRAAARRYQRESVQLRQRVCRAWDLLKCLTWKGFKSTSGQKDAGLRQFIPAEEILRQAAGRGFDDEDTPDDHSIPQSVYDSARPDAPALQRNQ